MATYNTLTRGSTGADVKKLQQSLIDKGYDLGKTGADGKYGEITEAAVTEYQKDNKLTVDGMAGKQTQGSLYTVPKTTTTTKATTAGNYQNTVLKANDNTGKMTNTVMKATDPVEYEKLSQVSGAATNAVTGAATHAVNTAKENQTYETDPIQPPAEPAPAAYDPATDAAYQSALATLMQVQQSAPVYKDSYSSQLQDAYDKIVNRDKFSYDVNADALYQQYKDQYIAQGKLAMADTMGQAAALNGGYGSSYAQSVGQQAYQGYMQQLNDVVPELYDRALAQYNQEGQNMLNQYAMLGDMADDEYAKYQDQLNKYYTDLDMARQDAETAYNRGYGAYRDSVGDYQWNKTFDYGVEQDAIQNNFTQQQIDETIRQNDIQNDHWQTEFDHMVDREAIEDGRYEEESGRADRNEAYDRIMNAALTGYTPTDDELKAAGMTRAEYDSYVNKYASDEYNANQPTAYNKLMAAVGTGYNPTDAELKAAGITREQWDAMDKYEIDHDTTSYNINSTEQDKAKEHVMSFIGTDYKPTDSELSAAGLTRAQYDAYVKAATSSETGNVMWTYTGAVDSQDNLIYENSLGERKTFGRGVNPYTGTSHPDAKNGTFSNGYQPDNIGGTKLTNSGMSTNVTGKNQTIWEANGKHWIWRGDLNTYIEVDLSDLDD